jgi:hypothetical protein
MLKIRQIQLDAIVASLHHRANAALARYARRRFPGELGSASDNELIELVERVRSTASTYGFQMENDVGTFLDLSIMFGEDFRRQKWAAEILSDDALHAPDKMELLRHKVRLANVDL